MKHFISYLQKSSHTQTDVCAVLAQNYTAFQKMAQDDVVIMIRKYALKNAPHCFSLSKKIDES